MDNRQRTAMKAAVSAPVHAGGGRASARRTPRRRRAEPQLKTSRVAVVLSLFLVLIIAALLMGGRVIIDPLLSAAAQERESHRMGDIILSSPDGTLCRHLSFDNATAELTEGGMAQCTAGLLRARPPATRGFSWQPH